MRNAFWRQSSSSKSTSKSTWRQTGMHNLSNKCFFCALVHAACWECPRRGSHSRLCLQFYVVSPELSVVLQRDCTERKTRTVPEPRKRPRAQVCSLPTSLSHCRLSSFITTVLFPQQTRGNLQTLSLGFPQFLSAVFALLLSHLTSHSTVCYFQQNCLKSLFAVESALAPRLLLICGWFVQMHFAVSC